MKIIEVKTSHERKQFIGLPWKLYCHDPNWVPPLRKDIEGRLNPKIHPFYRHGWVRSFLAIDSRGNALGRIMAMDDPRFNQENNSNQGVFGFFESIDDTRVSDALFDSVAQVLKERGRDFLFGPVEYSTNYECGLLIDGFGSSPKVMMPYNPPYYLRLFEHWGLKKNRDLYSWWFDDSINLGKSWMPILERMKQRHPINIRPFSIRNFERDLKKCMEVYDSARKDWWWSCVTLTEEEIKYLADTLRLIAHEKHVLLAEDQGTPVGFAITIPDLNEAIKPMNGSLSWFGIPYLGLLRLRYRLNRVKGARMMVLCVLPQYRRSGVAERLIYDTLDYGKNCLHYTNAELGWTDEMNDKINRTLERVGAVRCKTYRVFEKSLKEPSQSSTKNE